jgi:hypothetical protein
VSDSSLHGGNQGASFVSHNRRELAGNLSI